MRTREITDRALEIEGDMFFLQFREYDGSVLLTAIRKQTRSPAPETIGLGSFSPSDIREALDRL